MIFRPNLTENKTQSCSINSKSFKVKFSDLYFQTCTIDVSNLQFFSDFSVNNKATNGIFCKFSALNKKFFFVLLRMSCIKKCNKEIRNFRRKTQEKGRKQVFGMTVGGRFVAMQIYLQHGAKFWNLWRLWRLESLFWQILSSLQRRRCWCIMALNFFLSRMTDSFYTKLA